MSPRTARTVSIALAVVAVVAVGVLRFAHLDRNLVWHDEVYTKIFTSGYASEDWNDGLYTGAVFPVAQVRRFQQPAPDRTVADTVRSLARDEPQHPPLYYLLARVWTGAFGAGYASLRALSGVLSLLAWPAMWWLALELFGSRRAAWTAVALLAVSPFFVLYAQEAREYTLWGVWTLWSCAALLWAIRITEQRAPPARLAAAWGLFAACTVAGLYTSFSTSAVILAQLAYLAFRVRLRPTRVAGWSLAAMALAALLFVPWAWTLLGHFEAFQASMRWSSLIVVPRGELLATLALNLSRAVVDVSFGYDHAGAVVAVAAAVGLSGWALADVARHASRERAALPLLLVAVPIAMLLGPDLLFGGIRSVSARYLTPALLALLPCLAFLAARPRDPDRAWPWAAGALVAVGLLSCVHNARQDVVWTKGISAHLPEVAAEINGSEAPLVVGNRERHHPGNLLALSNLLRDDASMQFLPVEQWDSYTLPRERFDAIYLYSPTDPWRRELEAREGITTTLLFRDLYMELWRVEWGGAPRVTTPAGSRRRRPASRPGHGRPPAAPPPSAAAPGRATATSARSPPTAARRWWAARRRRTAPPAPRCRSARR